MIRIRFTAALLLGLLIGGAAFTWPAAASVSALVVEHASGRTISAVNADRPRYPASLTKMMTLYLLFDALDRGSVTMNTPLDVSWYAASRPPSKLGLVAGRTITVRAAILALATKSANDVAVVVAEALAGTEPAFARRMTAKARALGMRQTTFRNASGLHHPQQRTTARDMALLGRALLRDHPQYYGIFATRTFRWSGSRYGNHNRLMHAYRGMDGIKTGYTQPAGYNLVASASRNGRRLVGVVMGSRSAAVRNGLMASLLNQGFRTAPNTLAIPEAVAAKRWKSSKQLAARSGETGKAHRLRGRKHLAASRSGATTRAKREKAGKQVITSRAAAVTKAKPNNGKAVAVVRSRGTAGSALRRSPAASRRVIVQKKASIPAPVTIGAYRGVIGA